MLKKTLSLLLVLGTFCFNVTAQERPNIIVIMTDDQGNNLGHKGNPHLKTPNIDELANESIRFTNFHTENKCTTTRASLLTGKYPHKTGAWRTSKGRSMMKAEEYTLAEALRDAGYATGHFGKWHLGESWPYRALDQGFEHSVSLKTGGIGQIADYWGNDYFDDTYYVNGEPKSFKGYCTDVFFQEAIDYMEQQKGGDKPFFIYLATNVTHVPMKVAERYSKPYVDKGLPDGLAKYYGMIDNLDENFGKLNRYLKISGLDKNTIVLYTTDDGASKPGIIKMGKDDIVKEGWNMGLRGGKGSRFEGGHRVLSSLKLPNGNFAGDNDTLVAVMDIYPTMLELAGVELKENLVIDGRSAVSYFKKPLAPEFDERPLFINYFNPKDFHNNKDASVIWKHWRLTQNTELYDIQKDPGQLSNVAQQHPDIVKRLNFAYRQWHEEALRYVKGSVVRFVLGDERQPSITMTSQDHWTNKQCNVFAQHHAGELKKCRGPFKVHFNSSGKYKITLSRYPLYTGIAIGKNVSKAQILNRSGNEKIAGNITEKDFLVTNAKLKIGQQQEQVAITPDMQSVNFEWHVVQGNYDLDTWFSGSYNGKKTEIPAYFVTVERMAPMPLAVN